MHVLIVDDEADILTLVSAFFKKEGITSTCCNSNSAALACMKNQSFDYYLLDVHLQDGSGVDLAKHIQNEHGNANILLMSAYDDSLEGVNDELLPLIKFIKKPFSQQDLLAVMRLNNSNQ